MHRNGAVRLTSSIAAHCSSVVLASEAETPDPAFATSTSTRPQASSTAVTSSSMASVEVMSAGSTSVSPEHWLAVSRSSSSFRAVSATRYPSELSLVATARPIPRPAPVTMATGLKLGTTGLCHNSGWDQTDQGRGALLVSGH